LGLKVARFLDLIGELRGGEVIFKTVYFKDQEVVEVSRGVFRLAK
jgi:hypothetical protein